MVKGGKIYIGIGVMIPILAFIWLASFYTEDLGHYCLDFGSCTTMYYILYASIPTGLLICVRGLTTFEKTKTKKVVRYSILSGFCWASPIFHTIGNWQWRLIEENTKFILIILIILGIIFMAFAIRNFATRKTPTKKEKASLEKEDLEKRIRELEEKSKSADNLENS